MRSRLTDATAAASERQMEWECLVGAVGSNAGRHDAQQGNATSLAATDNTQSAVAKRVPHLFGFTGPSVAIDAPCSSSLVTT